MIWRGSRRNVFESGRVDRMFLLVYGGPISGSRAIIHDSMGFSQGFLPGLFSILPYS
jgi:hypothetical protein